MNQQSKKTEAALIVKPPLASMQTSDIAALREQINGEVRAAALAMVHNAIAQANEGNCVAIKYLFEMAGLYPAVISEDTEGNSSLAEVLLQRLGLTEDGAPKDNTVE